MQPLPLLHLCALTLLLMLLAAPQLLLASAQEPQTQAAARTPRSQQPEPGTQPALITTPPRITTIYPDTLVAATQRHTLLPAMQPARPTLGLALSGGGANSIAQIGVLRALDEAGIPVDAIAGTSMGAIIGGLYSSGYTTDEIQQIFTSTIPWESIFSIGDDQQRANIYLEQQRIRDRATVAIRFRNFRLLLPRSLNAAQPVIAALDRMVLNAPYHARTTFATLPVNFRAVTTDLVTGKRVTLTSGPLSEALAASSSVPILMAPLKRGNYRLVDGGLVANLPVDELDQLGIDCKIAIDTHGSMYNSGQELDLPWKAADQAMSILIQQQLPQQLQCATIVVAPDLHGHKATDFTGFQELIDAGYRAGRQALPAIRSKLRHQPLTATPIAGWQRTITMPNERPAIRIAAETAIQRATTIEEALDNLLATDLFTHVSADRNNRDRQLIIKLTPIPSIRTVTLRGSAADLLTPAEQALITRPLTADTCTNATGTHVLESLIRIIRGKGYPLVTISNCTIQQNELIITLTPGTISAITIQRDRELTDLEAIHREIKVDTLNPVKFDRAVESVNNLHETGVFNRVSMLVDYATRPDSPELRFNVEEKDPVVLRLGLRYDETSNARFLVDFRNENILGTTGSGGLLFRAGRDSYLLNLEFFIPRLATTHFTMSSRLFFDQHVAEFRDTGGTPTPLGIQKYGITHAFGTRIQKNGHLIGDVTLQNIQSYPIATPATPAMATSLSSRSLISLGMQFSVDSRDTDLMPTRGSTTRLRYELFSPLIDNDETLWQWSGSHERNIPLNSYFSLQLRGFAGFSNKPMPAPEQYWLGGVGSDYSHRFIGLRESAIPASNIISAGIQLSYRPPIDIIFPATIFITGNSATIWEHPQPFPGTPLIHGIGTGIAWQTPVGLARLTLARPIPVQLRTGNQLLIPDQLYRQMLYFSIGHTF